MDNLQTEVLEIEFLSYSKGLPTISALDFAQVLLRYTTVDNVSSYLENVKQNFPDDKVFCLCRSSCLQFDDYSMIPPTDKSFFWLHMLQSTSYTFFFLCQYAVFFFCLGSSMHVLYQVNCLQKGSQTGWPLTKKSAILTWWQLSLYIPTKSEKNRKKPNVHSQLGLDFWFSVKLLSVKSSRSRGFQNLIVEKIICYVKEPAL